VTSHVDVDRRIDRQREIDPLEFGSLLHVRQDCCEEAEPAVLLTTQSPEVPGGWECVVGVMVRVGGQHDLLQIVGAFHASSRFTGRLNRGKQQRDQNADDGNDDEQFDKCKTV